MSLVICSNKEDPLNQGGSIYKPYTFKNSLNTPMTIPTNSEIALQSIKLEKDGLFTLNNQSNRYFIYFGQKLTDTFTYSDSPRFPALTWIRMSGRDTESYRAFDTESLAVSIADSMNRGLYHPDVQGLANCSVKRDANVFNGYNLKFDKAPSASGTSNIPNAEDVFIPAGFNSDGFEWNNGHKRFKATGSTGARAYGIGSKFSPLSCCQGRFDCTFTNASTDFSIGLSRYCDANASFVLDGQVVDFTAKAFDYSNNHIAPSYCNAIDQSQFYDYVVKTETNANGSVEIKMYHAVCDDPDDDLISMKEVKYYGNYSGALSQLPYDLTTNASAATGIRYKLDGDQVSVVLMKGTAELVTLCSPDLTDAEKENYFKPIAMTCSYLYPKLEVGIQNEYLDITKWEGRDLSSKGWYYNGVNPNVAQSLPISKRQTNQDWWATLVWLGTASRYCRQVDTRIYNALGADHLAEEYVFQKTSGGKLSYDFVLITAQSDIYYPSFFSNAQKTLGFDGRNVADVPDVQSGSSVTYSSNVTPKLTSTSSVFVRLNNLTQLSMNAGTGNQSKIIYHCPRFDTAGNETGALFFEPGDRTYLKLNNPAPLTINSFDVDLVNEDETFADGIIGKTIVSLHIRDGEKH